MINVSAVLPSPELQQQCLDSNRETVYGAIAVIGPSSSAYPKAFHVHQFCEITRREREKGKKSPLNMKHGNSGSKWEAITIQRAVRLASLRSMTNHFCLKFEEFIHMIISISWVLISHPFLSSFFRFFK